jgi:hypothetical protein
LTPRENYARIANEARPIFRAALPAKPVQIAFFGGRRDNGRLKWRAVLFAAVIIQAPAGDRRHRSDNRERGDTLPSALARA